MNRSSRWFWLACCTWLLACKPSTVLLEGEVSLGTERLGFVDVQLIPAESMRAFLEGPGRQGKPFFSGARPPEKFSVKTDHEGNFFLNVTPGEYAVVAQASRGPSWERQEYRWLVWQTVLASGPAPRLTLSDANLVGSGCTQCIPLPSEPAAAPAVDEELQYVAPAEPVPENLPTKMAVMGSLDKTLIHRVIRANRGQIRYCYESLLMKFPNLSGTATVKFVIASTGKVATASIAQSTVANASLEECVAGRVRTWNFPKPRGGGVAIVTYPFRFKQG